MSVIHDANGLSLLFDSALTVVRKGLDNTLSPGQSPRKRPQPVSFRNARIDIDNRATRQPHRTVFRVPLRIRDKQNRAGRLPIDHRRTSHSPKSECYFGCVVKDADLDFKSRDAAFVRNCIKSITLSSLGAMINSSHIHFFLGPMLLIHTSILLSLVSYPPSRYSFNAIRYGRGSP